MPSRPDEVKASRRGDVLSLPHLPPVTRFRAFPTGSMMYFLDAVFYLAQAALSLLWWAVLLAAIVQTLISFNVLDTRNRFIWTVADFLYRLTEPLFRRVRRVIPIMGPVDLSPLIVLLLITAAEIVVSAAQRYLVLSGLYF